MGAGDNRSNPIRALASNALEQIADLLVLDDQLLVVSHVLILAATANGILWTLGFDTRSSRIDDFDQACAGVLSMNLLDLSQDGFPGDHKRYEDHKAFVPTDTLSAKGDIGDVQGDPISHLPREGMVLHDLRIQTGGFSFFSATTTHGCFLLSLDMKARHIIGRMHRAFGGQIEGEESQESSSDQWATF